METVRLRHVGLLLLSFLTLGFLVACGGGGSYDAPESSSTSTTPSWHTDYNTSANALVDADTLAGWINNGFKTESGDPVVVFDVDPGTDRIIGSTSTGEIEAFTIAEMRDEGPVGTAALGKTSSKMVPKGATIDAIIQDLGLEHNTVLVMTSSASGNGEWNLTRGWWMLNYWGLSEGKLKILDGGVAGLKAYDATLVDDTTAYVDPADSTFCINDLPAMNQDRRVTTKNVLDAAKTGTAKIIDARGSNFSAQVIKGRINGAIVAPTAGIGGGDLVNADGTFKTKAEMQAAFDAAGISSTDTIIVHCYSGYSATPIYFFIKEVMEYENVALYDGSWSAWSSHIAWEPANGFADNFYWGGSEFMLTSDDSSVATTDVIMGGILTSATSDDLFHDWDVMRYSTEMEFLGTTGWRDSYGNVLYDVDYAYTGSGNEVEEADYQYFNPQVADEESEVNVDEEDDSVTPDVDGGGC